MITCGEFLKRQGREFPKANAEGYITGEDYDRADLPMVVSCTACTMTMALHENRACDEQGLIYCDDCAGEDHDAD
jgi:hypothetical protein